MTLHPTRRSARRLTAGVSAIGALALMTACGSGETAPADGGTSSSSESSAAESGASGEISNKTVVFSPLGLSIPAMQGLAKGVEGYGAEKGFEIVVQDPKLDPQSQVQQLQQVVESGRAGGVWAIAVQPASLAQVVATAQEKGVPMILNGIPEDYGLDGLVPGVSFSTIDYAAQGTAIGEELGNCINEKLGGTAKVLWMESQAGTAGKAELEGAAREALTATAPNAEIATTVTVTDRAETQTVVANALQGNPDMTAAMGQNDEGALGALGAFDAAGKELTCVTEAGGNDEALERAGTGEIYAVVALQFEADMAQSFDTLTTMMADPTAVGQQLTVPQEIVKAGS